jgi:cytochrome d ubiquinol oxidase subunit II
MIVLAFAVLVAMLAAYVLLDGYDLGLGAVLLFVAKTDAERIAVLDSIGPYWNGNEVWLIAAGGALFALFPQVYASSFSAFYLPFMVLLWLLMFRGIAFELRGQFPNPLWHAFFDTTFAVSSTVLILLLGVALGNIVRGVPLNAAHYFEGTFAFILNPYAVGVGLLAVLAIAQHGAAWVSARVEGPPMERALRAVRILAPIVIVLAGIITLATFGVHSPLTNMRALPVIVIVPLISLAGLCALTAFAYRGEGTRTFTASTVFVAALLGSAAVTLFPYLLPGYPDPQTGLSIYTAPTSPFALATILPIVITGLILVAAYRTFVATRLTAKAVQEGAAEAH